MGAVGFIWIRQPLYALFPRNILWGDFFLSEHNEFPEYVVEDHHHRLGDDLRRGLAEAEKLHRGDEHQVLRAEGEQTGEEKRDHFPFHVAVGEENEFAVGDEGERDRGDPRYGVADGVVEVEDLVAKPVHPEGHRRGGDAHDDVTDDFADAVFVLLVKLHRVFLCDNRIIFLQSEHNYYSLKNVELLDCF